MSKPRGLLLYLEKYFLPEKTQSFANTALYINVVYTFNTSTPFFLYLAKHNCQVFSLPFPS